MEPLAQTQIWHSSKERVSKEFPVSVTSKNVYLLRHKVKAARYKEVKKKEKKSTVNGSLIELVDKENGFVECQ